MAPAGIHPAVVWGVILGAEAPDSDVLVKYLKGDAAYLQYHRGPTHGLITLPLQAAIITLLLTLLWPGAAFGTVFGWTLLGCLSHVIFDFGNDYGTQGLWPFSPRRIARDIMPIIDLWLLALVGGGWLITAVQPGHRQAIFVVVWLLILAYVSLRLRLRSRARQLVVHALDLSAPLTDEPLRGVGWPAERIIIHPTLLSLNAWRYAVKMPGEYWSGIAYVRQGRISSPVRSPNQMDYLIKTSLTGTILQMFTQWSRLPRAQITQEAEYYQVTWTDARYEFDGYSPFSATARLDQNGKVVAEQLGSKTPHNLNGQMFKRRLRHEMGREEL